MSQAHPRFHFGLSLCQKRRERLRQKKVAGRKRRSQTGK